MAMEEGQKERTGTGGALGEPAGAGGIDLGSIFGHVATLLPFVLALFGHHADPAKAFRDALKSAGMATEPARAAAVRQGATQGQRVGQAAASSLGAIGAGSSGVGQVQGSIAAGLAGTGAAQANQAFSTAQSQLALGLMPQFAAAQGQGPLSNLQSAIGLSLLGGKNPFSDLAALFTPAAKKPSLPTGEGTPADQYPRRYA